MKNDALPVASGYFLDIRRDRETLAGLASASPRAYLPRMSFLRTISPVRAYRDLRRYLASRKTYEVVFLALAIIVTWTVMFAIANNSEVEKVYRPNIVYVEQWSANRTDAEIIAQQKIDGPKEKAEAEAVKKEQAETQAAYKRLDDKLKKYGF